MKEVSSLTFDLFLQFYIIHFYKPFLKIFVNCSYSVKILTVEIHPDVLIKLMLFVIVLRNK